MHSDMPHTPPCRTSLARAIRRGLASLAAIAVISACAHAAGVATTAPPSATPSKPAPIAVPAIAHPGGETAAWWYLAGASRAASNGAMQGKARNVIIFLGDGMSLATVAAARILEGQRQGQSGEEHALAFETLPDTALSKTYAANSQTPDSASTMTAIATGAKVNYRTLGVSQAVAEDDCAGSLAAPLLSILELAERAGMGTGIVTTSRLTHATPAAMYAHTPDRDWEADADLPEAARAAGCRDIARQFIESRFGDGVDVALAGGRERFLPASERDPEYPALVGLRLDGRDLVREWELAHPHGRYVWNAAQLDAAVAAHAPRLLGLFEPSHMHYETQRAEDGAGEPSLAGMTAAAIRTLQARHDGGWLLLVEGARIDMAHHEGSAWLALNETIAFSDAVRSALDMTSASDTLVLVTADHSHTLSFMGYPVRGNPILGKVMRAPRPGESGPQLSLDSTGLPYTTLSYTSGPGYPGASNRQAQGPKQQPHRPSDYQPATHGRPDLRSVDTTAPSYLQEAMIPLKDETHGGEDVGVWARGPGADAVHGTIEQNVLFHILVQATPRLRTALCAAGDCNADGVPVRLPVPADFQRR
jgi:alkaline phosphatase